MVRIDCLLWSMRVGDVASRFARPRRRLVHSVLLIRDALAVNRYGSRSPTRICRAVNLSSSILTYWYFHLPNFILAALMYTLLGRALLG